ncbi:hypothetical protein FBR01_19350 [Anaerolineae bacterium CFX8]|nr:hypothetical protein [Anaerolineae bacterium CFX8]
MRKWIAAVVLILAGALPAAAQVEPAAEVEARCLAVVQAILNETLDACRETGRDQVCYGHAPLEAVPRAEADLSLAAAGDLADAAAVQSLALGALDAGESAWGLALARLSANMPDEAVTMLLFGAAEVENAGLDVPLVTFPARIRALAGANIRALPAPDAETVALGSLGQPLLVVGRLEDSSWLWVQLEDDRLGWVLAGLLLVEGDTGLLAAVDPADPSIPNTFYGPLQAVMLRAKAGERAACLDAPGGILAQTPAGERTVALWVNSALLVVQPSSTIYLPAQADEMAVWVLEGRVGLLAAGQSRSISAGERVRVPLTDGLVGQIAPRLPEPYVYAEARALPVMALPREIIVPVALGGVIIPGQPQVDPLTGVDVDDPCTVAAFAEARLRSGPGTNYPVRALIQAGDSARPDGRAAGTTDGLLWWRLTRDFWVRSDAVYAAGACGTLPLVEAPPVPVKP